MKGKPSISQRAKGYKIMNKMELIKKLEERTDRSAWNKGVTVYAIELVDELEVADDAELVKGENISKTILLNGASDWSAYSWGGSSLIYNYDIAERLCTPSELKKTKNGERRPNANEEWLDTQARALYQACNRVLRALGI